MNTSPNGDSRTPRDMETRDATARTELWRAPSTLPEPNPRVGTAHRWVRTKCGGQEDPVNVATSFREGWTPIDAAEYPELMAGSDYGSRWPEGVEIGGLLLCRTSSAVMQERAKHYRKKTGEQVAAVESQLDVPRDSLYGSSKRKHDTEVRFHSDAPFRRPGA